MVINGNETGDFELNKGGGYKKDLKNSLDLKIGKVFQE